MRMHFICAAESETGTLCSPGGKLFSAVRDLGREPQ